MLCVGPHGGLGIGLGLERSSSARRGTLVRAVAPSQAGPAARPAGCGVRAAQLRSAGGANMSGCSAAGWAQPAQPAAPSARAPCAPCSWRQAGRPGHSLQRCGQRRPHGRAALGRACAARACATARRRPATRAPCRSAMCGAGRECTPGSCTCGRAGTVPKNGVLSAVRRAGTARRAGGRVPRRGLRVCHLRPEHLVARCAPPADAAAAAPRGPVGCLAMSCGGCRGLLSPGRWERGLA